MGGALGALFIKAGYPVMFSSRHPEHLKEMAARLGPLAQAGPVEQAIAFGDVVVMVVPYAASKRSERRTVAPSPASHSSWTSAIRSRGAMGRLL